MTAREAAKAEQRRRNEEPARRMLELNAARRNQFINAVDAIIERLEPRVNPLTTCHARMQNLAFHVFDFGSNLPAPRRAELEAAWQHYQQQLNHLPPVCNARPGPGRSNTTDYSAGNDVVRAALQRLRAFTESQALN